MTRAHRIRRLHAAPLALFSITVLLAACGSTVAPAASPTSARARNEPTTAARAGTDPSEATEGVISTPAAAASLDTPTPSPRYSLPWHLRPVTAENMVRVDSTAAAFNDTQGNLDIALPTVIAASYRLTGHWLALFAATTIPVGTGGGDAPNLSSTSP